MFAAQDVTVYYLLDAARPSFLPAEFAKPYFVEPKGRGQCSTKVLWPCGAGSGDVLVC